MSATPVLDAIEKLQRDIADDAARTAIESFARRATLGMWDVTEPDPEEAAMRGLELATEELRRAVQYLDLRGLLVRPVAGQPQIVTFAETAA